MSTQLADGRLAVDLAEAGRLIGRSERYMRALVSEPGSPLRAIREGKTGIRILIKDLEAYMESRPAF